jgi:hypothetical protein
MIQRSQTRKKAKHSVAQYAEDVMRRRQISPDISRHIEAWTASKLKRAHIVVSVTFPCPRYLCTFSRINVRTNATCVGNGSVDRGYFRVTFGRTQGNALSSVRNVTSHSLTALTCGLMNKHIHHSSSISARSVTGLSRWSRTLRSMSKRRASPNINPERGYLAKVRKNLSIHNEFGHMNIQLLGWTNLNI